MQTSGTDCTPTQLADTANKERVHQCSTVNSCYDFGAHTYSNDKCGMTESCGTWRKKGDVLLQGCIRSEFCDLDAEYEKNPTKYNCPQGAKKLERPPIRGSGNEVPSAAGVPADGPERPVSADSSGRVAMFDVLGYSDLDILDGVEGLMGGLMKKDVRNSYDGCYEGIPRIINQSIDEVQDIDWADLFNWSKDWTEVQDSWSFMQNIIKEVPEEMATCSTVVADIISWAVTLVTSLSFSLLWTNLSAGAMGVMMGLMAKGTDLGVAFASHDFYKLGQDVGYMANTILDLGVAPATA